MGLDVYVGTFTRNYARDWETAVQRAGREAGIAVRIIRPQDAPDAVTEPAAIEPAIITWRSALNASLVSHLVQPLEWLEGLTQPHFTDKLDFRFTCRGTDPAGVVRAMGSTHVLLQQLEEVNQRTWIASDDTRRASTTAGASFAGLEQSARVAFEAFTALAALQPKSSCR